MSRALVLLIWSRHVGALRYFWRSGRGSAVAFLGKALILGYLLSIALTWGYSAWYALTKPADDPIRTWLRSWVERNGRVVSIPCSLFFLVTAVAMVLERPFRFSPTEVDFLQAGPFSRRQLVTYKISAGLSGVVFLTLLVAPAGAVALPFLSSFAGALLLLTFYCLVQLVVASLGTMVGPRVGEAPIRCALSLAVLGAVGALFWFAFGKVHDDPVALYRTITQSPGWRLALAPLRPFFEVLLAKRLWPDLVLWVLPCLAINGGLLAAIYALDARLQLQEDEAERSAAESAPESTAVARPRWSLPLTSLGHGAGSVAWRQAMDVVRSPNRVAFALGTHGFVLVFAYAIVRYARALLFLPTIDGSLEVNPAGVWICGLLAVMVPMMIAAGLAFDFRGDMGRMDVLKALPMAPLAVTAGQLFVPVVIASAMQWVLIGVIALALRSAPAGLWVAVAFAPPVSVVLMAIENLPSFWFPLRQTPGAKPEPFEALGHILLHPFLRMIGYAVTAGATSLAAVLALFLFGRDVAALVAAWLALAASGAGLVALLAHTFDRFDVTQDATA